LHSCNVKTQICVTRPQCVKELNIPLLPLPSAAVSAALPRGHAALAFVDVGVGFTDRAASVTVGFLRIYGFLHISICITPENMSTFDPREYLK